MSQNVTFYIRTLLESTRIYKFYRNVKIANSPLFLCVVDANTNSWNVCVCVLVFVCAKKIVNKRGDANRKGEHYNIIVVAVAANGG